MTTPIQLHTRHTLSNPSDFLSANIDTDTKSPSGHAKAGATTTSTRIVPISNEGESNDDLDITRMASLSGSQVQYKHVDGVGAQVGETKLEKDSFSFIGVVSLAVSCINSWVVLVTALAAGLTSGGPTASECIQGRVMSCCHCLQTFIGNWTTEITRLGHRHRQGCLLARADTTVVWGFVYATLASYCTTLSHGEMFAVYPTAGGQYVWAYMVSPPKWRAPISWATGLFNVVGLWLSMSSDTCARLHIVQLEEMS